MTLNSFIQSRAFAWGLWLIHKGQLYQHPQISLVPATSLQDTPRAGVRTQRAFFNTALALLGFVEGICDVPDLCFGLIARG
jgi:hypothetical protein